MRCAVCGESVPDKDMVWALGMATCYPCHQRRVKAGPRMLARMGLLFLLLVGTLAGVMIWLFPEITKR